MSTTASGTSPAAITSAWLSLALGPSTRNTGSDISTRSNSACSVIVGKSPKRRKMRPQINAGPINSTSREYAGKPG